VGQVVTDVQIVNGGIRVFFGPCCYKDLGTIQSVLDEGSEADIDPPFEGQPNPPTYSACAKANSIVDAVYGLVEIGFTQIDNAPWQYIGNIENAFGYDLDNNHVFDLMGSIMFLYLAVPGFSFGDTLDAIQKAKIVTRVEALLADDSSGVPTAALFEQIKGAFGYEMQFEVYNGVYSRAIDSIGRRDLDAIAKRGAAENTSYSCDAPAGPLFEGLGEGMPWRYVYDFRDGLGSWTQPAGSHQTAGIGLWGDGSGTVQNRTLVEANLPFTDVSNGSTILVCAAVIEFLGGVENMDDSQCWFGTDDTIHIGGAQIDPVAGNDPTIAGQHLVVSWLSNGLGSLEQSFKVKLAAYHADTVVHPNEAAYACRIIGVMYAGTGPGPMASA